MSSVIPRLEPLPVADPDVVAFIACLRQERFQGDIGVDYATRLSAATDNSIYQVLPAAVIFPRHTADVALAMRLLEEPRFHRVALTVRGGGTGTNGQSLTRGIVLDMSRHMAAILNWDEQSVTVQPGVVLDDLNAFLAPRGQYFAPNLSPSNRATLGGMIATDASGEGSRVHGKTAQHVLELEVVLRGGLVHRTRAVRGADLEQCGREPGLVGDAYRLVHEIAVSRRDDIARTFPRLQRYMTGYNLAHMASAEHVDLCKLMAGSEGSLGVVTEARLRLTRLEPYRALFVLHYPSFDAALIGARWLLETDPGSIEAIDETVLSLARTDVIYPQVKAFMVDEARAINLVEYNGHDEDEVRQRVERLQIEIARRRGEDGTPDSHALTWHEDEIESLWNLRKKGVGLLGKRPGQRRPVPFVEDTVVPPERLHDFVREFRAVLDEAGLEYGMFGHVDVGCLHVRPALDLRDAEDERKVRVITDRVASLVTRYGGLLWGEHGKGYRSEFVPHHFGPVLYGEMQRIKALFDPRNQFNPGKIATAAGTSQALVGVEGPTRGAQDRQISAADQTEFAAALHCNGNGQCFDTHPDSVMCPSSKITRDRIHSPKGRAGLMREWLRLLAGHGVVAADALRGGTALPWWQRLWQRLRHAARDKDFSHQVYDGMVGCLACKACATQCPIQVDVPDFRAQFLELYHRRYARPIGDYFTAALEPMLPWMAKAPRLVNAVLSHPLGRWITHHGVGITDAPLLDPCTAERRLARLGIRMSDAVSAGPRTVVIVPDAFTTFYEPALLEDTCRLLLRLGYDPQVLRPFENGKALHVKGFLRRLRSLVMRNSERLRRVAAQGAPMVGIEPAVVLTYRDEYPKMLGRDPGFRVALLQEWLADEPLGEHPRQSAGYRLLSHCTEQTMVGGSAAMWARVFAVLGVPLEIVKTGCCGMCGVFGLETRHKAESLGIFELSWKPRLGERDRTLATGFSCRHQVERAVGFAPRHPVQALLAVLSSEGA